MIVILFPAILRIHLFKKSTVFDFLDDGVVYQVFHFEATDLGVLRREQALQDAHAFEQFGINSGWVPERFVSRRRLSGGVQQAASVYSGMLSVISIVDNIR